MHRGRKRDSIPPARRRSVGFRTRYPLPGCLDLLPWGDLVLNGRGGVHDPVAWNGKRGWDVNPLSFRNMTLRSPHKSSREWHVDTIRDADGDLMAEKTTTDAGRQARWEEQERAAAAATRDIADVPAVEIITTAAVHLMSAAAVKVGLADNPEAETDLDEARKLINALAGLITAGAPEISDMHARSLRDGLRSLQLAFREASAYPDAPGEGPGEKFTGSVV